MLFGFCKVLQWFFGISAIGFLNLLFLGMSPITGQEVMDTTPAGELKRLRQDLLRNYEMNVRPFKNVNQEVRVLIYYDVRHILELNVHSIRECSSFPCPHLRARSAPEPLR
ncbi:neur_chan_LBD domain-containing protein [Nephila pilipes]|uniref:Neur_chan_LBD domain-containing protein n=1 Tax=Nephila pilipes TaxID=299642 RepID=A0A8X6TZ70_NEPPI|nr:neur_chan_LBD domain-containing protein [Nephila pilipes]